MIGQRVNGQDVNSKTNSFRHRIFVVLYGTITEALIFAAAQILMPRDFECGGVRAALTVCKSVSMVTINQQGRAMRSTSRTAVHRVGAFLMGVGLFWFPRRAGLV